MNTVQLRQRLLVIGFFAMLIFLFVPAATAEKFNDVWFKLKLAAKGHTLDSTTGASAKLNFSQTIYLHLLTNGPAQRYDIDVWTLRDAGWTNATASTQTFIGTNENVLSDFALTVLGTNTHFVHIYHTVFITTKTSSAGVMSATYDSMGEIDQGTVAGKNYYGGCIIKGTLVPTYKLPFVP